MLEASRIEPDPNQPRKTFDRKKLEELASSLTEHGFLQPLLVRFDPASDRYRLIAGARRFAAARLAGITELPCWIQNPADQQILVRQIAENWQRADLQPFELADALLRLKESLGLTQKELARKVGKSEGEVSRVLSVLQVDERAQAVVRQTDDATVTRGHLYAIGRAPQESHQAIVEEVRSQGLTIEQTQDRVRQALQEAKPRTRGAPVHVKRYLTSAATVTLTFRRRHIGGEAVLAALDEARELATREFDAK